MNKEKNTNKETLDPKNVDPKNAQEIYSDVQGSYTGVTEDGEKPIQDADDL